MSLYEMALKSGIAKDFEVRAQGVVRSDERDYPERDWIPLDAKPLSSIAERDDWDIDEFFLRKWDTLARTPMRPVFNNTWIEWVNPAGRPNAALVRWDEATEAVWCEFATASPCVTWVGRALMKPMDHSPYVCIIPSLSAGHSRVAWDDTLIRACADTDVDVPVLPLSGRGDSQQARSDRFAFAALFLWGFIPITSLALKLPHVKNIDVVKKDGRAVRRRLSGGDRQKVIWRKLTITPSAAGSRGGKQESRDLLASHVVRGHFKTFTSDAPLFGKLVGTYWIPAHSRGNAKNGFVGKDYAIGGGE